MNQDIETKLGDEIVTIVREIIRDRRYLLRDNQYIVENAINGYVLTTTDVEGYPMKHIYTDFTELLQDIADGCGEKITVKKWEENND